VTAGFRVGVTADIRPRDGVQSIFDFGALDRADGVEWEFLAEAEGARELQPNQVTGYDALVVYSPRVNAASLDSADRLKLIARLGVGYDSVDVPALTRAGVLLTITPDGVRRPMASSAMAFVLALAHRMFQKDADVRGGGWGRFAEVGAGLTGRTLGLLGVGNVGTDLVHLSEPFDLRRIAHDPYVAEPPSGVELVDLETLFRESDFLCVLCPLTAETRGIVDARLIALMKPTAFLVNVARGPIVDQAALTEALRERRIAGAALDVFEREPIDPGDPLLGLDNVILAPHAIGLTDELFAGCGDSACRSVLAVADGRVPDFVVNREALGHERLRGLR
jgi:D-3-phosphoglycerate dehydrogenase